MTCLIGFLNSGSTPGETLVRDSVHDHDCVDADSIAIPAGREAPSPGGVAASNLTDTAVANLFVDNGDDSDLPIGVGPEDTPR